MKLSKLFVPLFTVLSAFVASLFIFLLATKTFPKKDVFLQTCGEILKNFQNHLHITPQGIFSIVLVVVALISAFLVTAQIVAYFIAIRKHNEKASAISFPQKLTQIISRHKILLNCIVLIDSSKMEAFTFGIIRTRIVVSTTLCEALSEKELESVLLHELYHLQKRHPLWSFLVSLVSRAFFFVPIVDYLAQQIRVEFELVADTFAIESQGTSFYLNKALLLNILSADNASNFSAHAVEKRIDFLVSQKRSPESVPVRKLVLSLLSLVVMSSFSILQPKSLLASSDSNIGSSCQIDSECVEIDCSNYTQSHTDYNFSPLIPASFSF